MTGDRVTSGQRITKLACEPSGEHVRRENGPRRGETMKPGAPMRWLWHRAGQARGRVGSLIDHHEESHGAGTGSWQTRPEFPFGTEGIE